MRDAMPTIPGLARLATATLLLAACSQPAPQPAAPPAQRACTMIGCEDGLTVAVEGTPDSAYRLEIRAPGEEIRVQECPSPAECGQVFLVGFLPEEVTVELVTESGERSTRTVRPEIETVQPNGPDCPPTCRQARVTVPWPGNGNGAEAAGELPGDRGATSAEAAREVVRAYYRDLGAGDHSAAYRRWAGEGQASGQSFEQFRRGYADTASVAAEVGAAGRIEGAAGSRYVEVPVTIRARTRAGADQCFRGTYTLRRAVVPGAPAEQSSWRIASANVAACAGDDVAGDPAGAAPGGVIDVVESFGRRLAAVSLLAPPATVREDLREQYGPLVTAPLLAKWLADPARAPGRQVSSPWPERIEVNDVRALDAQRYRVAGEVVLVTSADAGSAAGREPVALTVQRQPGGEWRIADWTAASPRS